ncbi:hypothetical protein [Endozoicomonas sp. OPT23]|uniref:hypothetical protein n=1 Tax=Endozoicomonas sp. OPT23 TaxID=2072845 RepID=UPI001891EAC7|nr:hypothetical protein [Endozoicomonas sp. OPT23]
MKTAIAVSEYAVPDDKNRSDGLKPRIFHSVITVLFCRIIVNHGRKKEKSTCQKTQPEEKEPEQRVVSQELFVVFI